MCHFLRHLIIILLCLIPVCSFSQTKYEYDSITKVLEKVFVDDQKYRLDEWNSTIQKYGTNSKEFLDLIKKMNRQDSINLSIVGNLIDKYGWLSKEQTSEEANQALFLVIQHASLQSQFKYLPVLKEAVKAKKAKASDYALLVDRTNMYQGKFQIYGSQFNYDSKSNIHIYPIYNEPYVNKRRKSVDLPPMEEYVKMVDSNLTYTLPNTDAYKNKIVIKGSAIQKENNLPLENVLIYKHDNRLAGSSDASGFFQIVVDKKIINHSLSFKKEGFQTTSVKIDNADKEVFEFNVVLTRTLVFEPETILIPKGTFQMGSNDGDSDEKPIHTVTVDSFFMGKYEVTNAQFCQFLNEKGNQPQGGTEWIKLDGNWKDEKCRIIKNENQFSVALGFENYPVTYISWDAAVAYCDWLSNKTGKNYRLPSEAEWEYAAGNGSKHTKYSWGNNEPSANKGGNVADEALKKNFPDWEIFTGYNDGYVINAPVGSFAANDFGLYDMTGNVWEWCSDWKGEYNSTDELNPKGVPTGTKKVIRGGGFLGNPSACRVADRYSDTPDHRGHVMGFRVAITLK